MRVFQSLVGPDLDADGLLEPARLLATKRVVVKRPDYAPPLANVATPNAVVTKGHRFDIWRYASVNCSSDNATPAFCKNNYRFSGVAIMRFSHGTINSITTATPSVTRPILPNTLV